MSQRNCALCWILGLIGLVAAIAVIAVVVYKKFNRQVDYSFTEGAGYWPEEDGPAYGNAQTVLETDENGVPYTTDKDFEK